MEGRAAYSLSYTEDSLGGYDINRRLHSENEYLRDRVRSCEKGLATLYQLLHLQDKPSNPPRVLSYHRSASQQFKPSQLPHHSPKSEYGDDLIGRQVTISELKDGIQRLVSERNELVSQLEDLKQVTEAAKRERVLAIDEKDKLLHSSHLLRVALERKESSLKECEEERDALGVRCREMEKEVTTLRRASEEARQTRSLALEERSKVIEERNQLKVELSELQTERDRLFEEKVQMQTSLQEVTTEKRKMQQEVELLSTRCTKFENVARKLKEQNEILNERDHETLTVTMTRAVLTQPWGFSIEGGRNSEFFHHDPAIVVTGIADDTPASNVLSFGDRILLVNRRDFRNVTRKEAAEVLRSCDQLSVSMEISRIVSKLTPRPIEVKIPGKKVFGFCYQSRLFVSSVEEGSAAADWLLPGDEIVQVMGKSATNLKVSHFKQILKSCKDGVSITVHRLPRGHSSKLDSSSSRGSKCSSDMYRQKPPSEFYQSNPSYQSPGTPGSTSMSETSAGYHSSHSLPSVSSNVVSPVGQDMKTGQTGIGTDLPAPRLRSRSEQSQQSGYEMDQTVLDSVSSRYRTGSGSMSLTRSGYRYRPVDLYAARAGYSRSERYTLDRGYGNGHSSLMTSMANQRSDGFGRRRYSRSSLPRNPRSTRLVASSFSASVDQLETECSPPVPRREPHDQSREHHVIKAPPPHPRQAFSMNNMSYSTHVV